MPRWVAAVSTVFQAEQIRTLKLLAQLRPETKRIAQTFNALQAPDNAAWLWRRGGGGLRKNTEKPLGSSIIDHGLAYA
ncbi:hypothetical protein [Hymenobacter latericus]|uniref:hypothetical protein n=1 Tax=Hymenobacter sp. YIM 151858-1 TaxID=2987688 RepID=UPI0022274950|nr:hypothetical protein [Hymenobacter sp. YIM 151858-1]UYZ60698.1 hypothetical protein OIS50_07830 [Hymenobacter sp. YIM 151858-1]